MNYKVNTIDEYLEIIPSDRKKILVKLISILKEYFPYIEGNMEYNMPSFNPICALASQKNYVSFYIHQYDILNKYREDLGKLKVGKSCIRFKKMEQIPEKILRKILSEIKNKK